MIHYKTTEEIELIGKAALLVGEAIAEVAKILRPGVTTLQIDQGLLKNLFVTMGCSFI